MLLLFSGWQTPADNSHPPCRLILVLRMHGDAQVRRALLYAFFVILQIVPMSLLLSDMPAELGELRLWVQVSLYPAMHPTPTPDAIPPPPPSALVRTAPARTPTPCAVNWPCSTCTSSKSAPCPNEYRFHCR